MAFDPHRDLAYSTVATAPIPAASGVTLSVTAGQGTRFPAPGARGYDVTIWAAGEIPVPTNAEIAHVTGLTGDQLTLTRGTPARAIVVGDQIALTVTAKVLTDIETAIPSTAGLISGVNVSAGATSQTLSALTFSNSNGVSFGLTGSVITGTVKTDYQTSGAYLTTAALSQDSSKYAGINSAITGGSLTVNTSGVSINLPAYLTTAMASGRGTDFVQATAAFAGTSASGTINSTGISVSVGPYLTTGMLSNAATISNIKVSAGASSANLSALTFANGSGVSFGLNAGTITASVAAAGGAQTGISGIGASDTTYTSGTVIFSNQANITIGSSVNAGSQYVRFSVGPYITTAMLSNAVTLSNINLSAGTTSNNASAFTFSNANGVSFGLNAGTITGSVAAAGGAQTGISGLIVADATYTSGTVSFSNAGNITISSSTNGASQYIRLSVAAQTTQSAIKGLGVSNTGQTAGNTGISTGVDWVLAGSSLITLSQSTAANSNTIWIQHPAWLTTADLSANSSNYIREWALTGNTSGTTSSLQGSRLYLSGGNSLTISGSSNSLVFSVGNYLTTAMASNAATISNINLSAGTTSNLASAFTFSNANGVSFGLNAGTITGSVAAAGGAQTGISGIVVSDTTYTSGTVSFSNQANITIASSVNAGTQYIRLSGNAAQTNQSAIKAFGVSNTGQTAGNTGVSTGIDWVLAGSNSITLSQSTAGGGPNTVWVQHPAWLTTAMLSNAATLSNINVSGGTTSSNLSAFKLIDSNGVSWSVDTGSKIYATVKTDYQTAGAYLTTADLSANSSNYLREWALTGNTSGTTSSLQGTRLYFSGGNSITVSGSSNSIVFSVGNYLTTADLSANSSKYAQEWALTGNTAGTTSSAQGTRWYFSGGANLTISGSSNSLVFSAGSAAPSPVNFSAGTTSSNLGSVVFSNSNGISFGLSGSTITASGNTVGPATTVYSVASANSVGTVTRWAAEDHRHAGIGAVGISTSGNTSGTTGSVLGTYWFQGGNNITVSQITSNNGSHTLVLSASSYSTADTGTTVYSVASANSVGTVNRWAAEDHRHAGIGAIGISTSGNTSGTTGSVLGTYWFQGGNNLTVSQITSNNGSHTLVLSAGAGGGGSPMVSAGTTSNTLGTIVFSNSNAVSFGLSGSTITANVNTVGTATTVYSVASANSVGTVTRWAAEDHRHAGIGGIGISTSGNSAGTSGSNLGTYWFQGGQNVTLSQITSNNGSHTIVVSGATDGTMSMWPYPLPQSATSVSTYYSGSTSQGAGGGSTQTGYTFSLYVVPMPIGAHVAFSELRLAVSNSRSTAGTGTVTHIYSFGIYSNNASTLSLVKPYYGGLYFTQNSITSQVWSVWTASTGTQSSHSNGYGGIRAVSIYSSGGNISANSQMEPGMKFIRVDDGVATTLTEGQYYGVLGFASMSASVNVYAQVGVMQSNVLSTGPMSDLGRENSTQTSNYLPAWGAISTTFTSVSNALGWFPLPNAINIANMTMSNSSGERYHFPMMRNHS